MVSHMEGPCGKYGASWLQLTPGKLSEYSGGWDHWVSQSPMDGDAQWTLVSAASFGGGGRVYRWGPSARLALSRFRIY